MCIHIHHYNLIPRAVKLLFVLNWRSEVTRSRAPLPFAARRTAIHCFSSAAASLRLAHTQATSLTNVLFCHIFLLKRTERHRCTGSKKNDELFGCGDRITKTFEVALPVIYTGIRETNIVVDERGAHVRRISCMHKRRP